MIDKEKIFEGRPVQLAPCKGVKDISGNTIPDNLVGVVNPDNPYQPMWIPEGAIAKK